MARKKIVLFIVEGITDKESLEILLDGFIDLMCNSTFAVDKEYKDSWDFIKKDNNSIKRFTNFNILLNDYLNN